MNWIRIETVVDCCEHGNEPWQGISVSCLLKLNNIYDLLKIRLNIILPLRLILRKMESSNEVFVFYEYRGAPKMRGTKQMHTELNRGYLRTFSTLDRNIICSV